MGILLGVVGIVCVAGCTLGFGLNGWGDWTDWALGVIAGILVAILVCAIIFGGGWAIACCGERIEVSAEPIEVISLKDNYGVEGYFYYRRGSVDSELEYVYLYETTKHGAAVIAVDSIPANRCYIREIVEGEVPHIEVYHSRPKSNFLYNTYGNISTEYILVIPTDGIVKDQYIVDLE
jgi:hypothetical protein